MANSRMRGLGGCGIAIVALGALGAAPAQAEPVNAQPRWMLGVQGGMTQSAAEAMSGLDASSTLGGFARIGFSHRWALQFDLGRVRHDEWSIYSSTAAVMHAFGSSRWLVPMVRAGVGFDVADGRYDDSAVHAEAAAVLELRLDGGLVLGGDLSIGARNASTQVCLYDAPMPELGPNSCDGVSVFRSTYRAAKITVAIAF